MARASRAAAPVGGYVLIHFDGSSWSLYPARFDAVSKTLHYATGEVAIDVCRYAGRDAVSGGEVYVLLAEPAQTIAESDFHAARRRVSMSALFDNHSDIMEFARQAALWVELGIALLTYISVQSLSGQVAHIATLVK